jgi:hypothetical protein
MDIASTTGRRTTASTASCRSFLYQAAARLVVAATVLDLGPARPRGASLYRGDDVTLRLVGAGLPRTGTKSLQIALERLLGGRCYHMHEVFGRLDHVPVWRLALRGELPDWNGFLRGYVATVDWPAAAFWAELVASSPHAVVLLSTRDDAETWWHSADETILQVARRTEMPEYGDWLPLFHELLRERFTERWDDPAAAMAAYERHNAAVRSAVPPDRLVDWRPGDGWGPVCQAFDLPVPEEPFPHANTREEWDRSAT